MTKKPKDNDSENSIDNEPFNCSQYSRKASEEIGIFVQ